MSRTRRPTGWRAACLAVLALALLFALLPADAQDTTGAATADPTHPDRPHSCWANGFIPGLADCSKVFLTHYGLWAIFVLMLLETGMILHGVPSELIMFVGGREVARTPTELFAVIVVGTVGAALGSLIPYWAALYGGRPFIMRHRHFFRMDEARMDKLEAVFRRPAGGFLVFVCRLLPFLRAFVSIPAGLARMNFALFTFLSTAGALLFNFVLAYGAWLTKYEPSSVPAKVYQSLEHWTHDHWLPLLLVGTGLIVLAIVAWRGRTHVARHYVRLMPQGWEGAIIASGVLLLAIAALFLAAPATFRGFVRGSQEELVQAGQAESGTPWVMPLLILLSIAVLLFFLIAVRHEAARLLSRLAGRRKDDGKEPPQP